MITDEVWELIGPCFPAPKATGRPPMDRRLVAEAVAWKFRTGSPWRDVPERFGNWNTISRHVDRWAEAGGWACALEAAQQAADARGELEWVCSIDSTIVRAHQHAATLPRHTGALSNSRNLGPEPADHAIGRSRGGPACKIHAVSDGKGRLLAFALTAGQAAGTSLLPEVPGQIRVPRTGPGRPRTRPDRVLADKGDPSRANRARLADRGITATIPDRRDQAEHRRRRGSAGGRPPAFDPDAYRGRNVIERCFAKLEQWRGIARRTCKTARSHAAAITLAATLHWAHQQSLTTRPSAGEPRRTRPQGQWSWLKGRSTATRVVRAAGSFSEGDATFRLGSSMAMSFTPTIQGVVDRYARSLGSVRGLFDLYPDPRPQGAPPKKYRPLPPAIVQGVTASFESFAEELVVVAMIKGNATSSWAHVAAHANMTNPTVKELVAKLDSACSMKVSPSSAWSLKLWKQSGVKKTAWSRTRNASWADLERDADSWMQVRHCLTHGLVTGTEPAVWPGPVSGKSHAKQASLPAAMDVLAESASGPKKSLTFYSAVNACLVYTAAAEEIAKGVAGLLGDPIDVSALQKFDSV